MTKKIIFLIFITLALRLISLNQSLWLDETISANVVKNYSYQEIITKFGPGDFHPPFFYLTLKAWTSVFGFSEIGLRSLSVLFSLITIFLVYKNFGFWPSLLLSVNPLFVYYSQEARMYSMVTLLVLLSFLSFQKNKIFLYFLFTFLSLFTFYGLIFFFVSVSLYFLIKKDYKNFIIYSFAPALALIFLSPLLIIQYQNSRELLKSVLNWSSVLGTANLKNLLLIPVKFAIGRISFYPKIIYYLISAILVIPLWTILFFKSFKNRQVSFIFWSTLIIGFIFSLFTPMFQYFRFLYLLPFFCILLRKSYFYSFIFFIFSCIYLFNPAFHREEWKSLVASLPNTIYMIKTASDPVIYYNSNIKIIDLATPPTENKITVIPYISEIHGLDYQTNLQKLGYQKISTQSFRELTTEIWSK